MDQCNHKGPYTRVKVRKKILRIQSEIEVMSSEDRGRGHESRYTGSI